MRLGLIYHQFVDSGGLEKYLLGFSRSLVLGDHAVDVVTTETDAVTVSEPSIRLHMLKRLPLSSMLRLWDFAWRAETYCRPDRSFRSNVDLTIGFGRTVAHDLHRAGGGCHAIYSRLLPSAKRFGLKNRLELSLEWQLYTSGKTRHFVVNASKVKEELVATYNVEPDRCSVIHTAVDTSQFFPCDDECQRNQLRAELGMPADRKVVLFVSSSHRRKGLGTIIEAMKSDSRFDTMELWIAGKPLDSRHRQLAADGSGLMSRLKFLGNRSDLPSLYRASDAFVHPTLYDACANTVLQAMASGTPSIVSAADGAAEFIEHGSTGFLLKNPGSAEELGIHLAAACNMQADHRRFMSEAARQRMLPLTWGAHVDRWEELFVKVTKP